MRRWLLAAVALLAALSGVVLFVRARLDGYITAHRDELAARASAALGRHVHFESCTVSLWGGLHVDLGNVRIDDDPRFGSADFFRAGTAEFAVSLLGVLVGRYQIHRLILADVTATLIRDSEGWNVDSLVAPRSGLASSQPITASHSTGAAPGVALLPNIDTLELHGAQVSVIDRRRSPPSRLSVDHLTVGATNLGFDTRARFTLSAALLGSATSNFELTGRLSPGTPPVVEVEARWAPLGLAALAPYVPALAGRTLQGTVSGDLRWRGPLSVTALPLPTGTLTLRGIGLGSVELPLRLGDLSGTLRLTDEAIDLVDATVRVGAAQATIECHGAPPRDPRLACAVTAAQVSAPDLGFSGGQTGDELRALAVQASLQPRDPTPRVDAIVRIGTGQVFGAPFRDAAVTAHLQPESYVVETLSLTAFDGTLRANADCQMPATLTPRCRGHARIDGMQVGSLLASQHGEETISGRLDATVDLSASGHQVGALRASLDGGGPVSIRDGVLRHVNLAKVVLGALPGAANLFGAGDATTPFRELRATMRVANQRVATNDAHLIAAEFTADGRGGVTFDGALDARGSLTTPSEFGCSLVSRLPILSSLTTGPNTAVTVPFRVTGTIDDPRIQPDSTALAQSVGHGAAAALGDLLGTTERSGMRSVIY